MGDFRRLDRAVRFIRETDLSNLPDGRTEIDADDVFALCHTYVTRPVGQGRWEAHRRYGDVQIVIAGMERIGWSPRGLLRTMIPYDEERDVEFFEGARIAPEKDASAGVAESSGSAFSGGIPRWLTLTPGLAAVFFPRDAHMPEIALLETPTPVRKVVIKFALDNASSSPRAAG